MPDEKTVYEVDRNVSQLRVDMDRRFDELSEQVRRQSGVTRAEFDLVVANLKERDATQQRHIDRIDTKLATWTWRFVGSVVFPVLVVVLAAWLQAGGK